MKYFKNIGAVLVLGILFSQCKFIDPEEFTLRSADQVKRNFANLGALRVAPFSHLPTGYNTIGNSWLASASDEAEEVLVTESIQNFNIGNWNQYSNPDNVWAKNYQGIRKANDFSQMADTITWYEWKLSNPTAYNDRVFRTNLWKNEMFFLRGFFYFELIKRYGGVPLIKEKLNMARLDSIASIKRSSFSDCVEYIVTQCDTAAKNLPVTQVAADYGEITKGAALALKARTLLYAASDLFNKSGNSNPVLGYTDGNRQQRWIRAAEACKAVLDMAPSTYALHTNYGALFLLGSAFNKEVIFECRRGALNSFEAANYSIGFNGGRTGTCPSQNLVDAYEMKDGTAFSWSNPAQAADPYLNRDPRLALTVVLNNATFNGRKIELWEGGKDGLPLDRASKTGYYLSKYVVQNLDLTKNQTSYHQWLNFRLAEMYLNYAEAMNEAFGPDNKSIYTLTAREAVNLVRARAGVVMPAFPLGMAADQFRTRLRNERRVELAFEDHRYWDVRRWGIGSSVLGGDIKGVKIAMVDPTHFTYTPYLIETRTYNSKMDLYPIPEDEVVKSKGNLAQNPGW
ncbi:MAG: RagB/SusD family nutrient uptake outer membrane protein [Prolixibacteraceae bacterium]|jgi:hypothetical protein|nr:RagB/SusD family nutrient uptake outer membrane protein [Prolixibacteraceae bacterium]